MAYHTIQVSSFPLILMHLEILKDPYEAPACWFYVVSVENPDLFLTL